MNMAVQSLSPYTPSQTSALHCLTPSELGHRVKVQVLLGR